MDLRGNIMQRFLPILKKCTLFSNLTDDDILHIAQCMRLSVRSYPADSYLFLVNDTVDSVGVVLDGEVEIAKESIIGGRHIIAILQSADIFGEGIVCTSNRQSPVIVRTRTITNICYLPFERLLRTCSNSCSFHTQLIYNMMLILGEKNLHLNRKLELLTLKGMREKIATYLLMIYQQSGTLQIELPFNRNELAEYLNVSRTSMCRELRYMKEDGLIDYHMNHIKILDLDALMECLEE